MLTILKLIKKWIKIAYLDKTSFILVNIGVLECIVIIYLLISMGWNAYYH